MNISPIAISKNFAVRNQIANKSYQTNFKGLGADTVSFSGKQPLTAQNIEERFKLAMSYRGSVCPEDAVKHSNLPQFIDFLYELKPNKNDSKATKRAKKEKRELIINLALNVDAEGKTPEKINRERLYQLQRQDAKRQDTAFENRIRYATHSKFEWERQENNEGLNALLSLITDKKLKNEIMYSWKAELYRQNS